jgi:hypothetical protein
MAMDFSQEERVAFEKILKGFHDGLVMSRLCTLFQNDQTSMARQGDVVWRPEPYILRSFAGLDQSANFQGQTQLSVPITMQDPISVPWVMDSLELRDALQNDRLGKAAKQRLASEINAAILNAIAYGGTLAVTRTAAAAGFDDLAQADAILNEQGVLDEDRYMALGTRDYNNMASNLASRQTVSGKVQTAYERAFIGHLASFDTYKLDYGVTLPAKTAATVTVNGANQYYTPVAKSTAATGQTSNVDNRYQTLPVTVGSGTLEVGDIITIDGVYAVHHIRKTSTGQLKTFRIAELVSGGGGTGNVKISPPIISGGGSTNAELQYKNVSATPANGATINVINYDDATVNCFWTKNAIELLPGTLAIPTDAGAAVMRGTVRDRDEVPGIEVVMQKQFDINTSKTKFRCDVFFGVGLVQPEMAGVMLFSQTA